MSPRLGTRPGAFALAFALFFLSLVAGSACREKEDPKPPAPSVSLPLAPPPPTSGDADGASSRTSPSPSVVSLPSFAPIVKKVDPSVVTIMTAIPADARHRKGGHGVGTGFFVEAGVVVTNAHVIDTGTITVRLADQRELEAKVVGKDVRTDIALLSVDVKDMPLASLGDSDEVDVGDWVLAIGNPFGLSHTVNVGIVSAKGRTREDVPLDPSGYYDFLQTDASINPGNSGGPLVDLRGRVVGINTAIRGGGAQGIGFAIPINMVRELMPKLLRFGRIVRSSLGATTRELREISKAERESWKIPAEVKGVVVDQVEPGGPGYEAGLTPGDVITAFQGRAIERGALLRWLASSAGVGQIVSVQVTRAGSTKELKVRLGELVEPRDPKVVGPERAPLH